MDGTGNLSTNSKTKSALTANEKFEKQFDKF